MIAVFSVCVLVVPLIEPTALCMPSRCSPTRPHPSCLIFKTVSLSCPALLDILPPNLLSSCDYKSVPCALLSHVFDIFSHLFTLPSWSTFMLSHPVLQPVCRRVVPTEGELPCPLPQGFGFGQLNAFYFHSVVWLDFSCKAVSSLNENQQRYLGCISLFQFIAYCW